MRVRLSKRWRVVKWVGAVWSLILLVNWAREAIWIISHLQDVVSDFSIGPGYVIMALPVAGVPFLGVALPTAYLFWRDRRYPRGHCQTCGYDLTGNTSGVCPECGELVTASSAEEVRH
jgi:hypothetical protein